MTRSTLMPLPDTVTIRVAGRLGMAFFLDVLRIVCDGRDLLDGLILMTIGQANLGHLDRTPDSPLHFAGYDDNPDAQRLRPISANALAASLGQPFETIRRRTGALRRQGACDTASRGLVIPVARLVSAREQAAVFSINQKVRGLSIALRDLGLLRTAMAFDQPSPHPRAVARLVVEYVLRQLETMGAHIEDPTMGVLLIHVIRTTTEHLDDTYTELSETEDLMRDELRRPASIIALAARAALPRETARRHLAELASRGWVARADGGGYYLTREMLRATPWPEARRDNVVNLNRMFDGLASLAKAAAGA